MKKMKTVKILIPLLLLTLLTATVSPVMAKGKGSIEYAVIGTIQDMYDGPGTKMFLTLEGRLNLGTPDFESGWSDWMDEQRYDHNEGQDDWWFEGGHPDVPAELVAASFENIAGKQYRANIQWWSDFVWDDHFRTYDYRWFNPKGSWSGKLVALWSDVSPEKFSVQLSPWKVEKTVTEGNMNLNLGESHLYQSWDIYTPDGNGGEDHVGYWEIEITLSGEGYDYSAETLNLYFNGQIKTKGTTLGGSLDLQDNRFWELGNGGEHVDVQGQGEFGPYWIGFGQGDGDG